jgi:hypothetical protein
MNDVGVKGISVHNIGVEGSGGIFDFYASGGGGTNYGPFTGGHEVKLAENFPKDIKAGMIVSVTGKTHIKKNKDGIVCISSTLPVVQLSSLAGDKAVFGAFVSEYQLPSDHWYQAQDGERFAIVNALGEGRVWVCSMNGNIEAGDYITTSYLPGYGQRQNDDLLHSYTLGKATETVNWDLVNDTIEFNGQTYKIYLIAVVYTSG